MSGKKNVTPLSISHPELAQKLLDKSLAKSITRGSRKVVEWTCDLGHIFSKRPSDIKKTSGCPYCHGTKVLAGFNDLKSKFPDIALEIVDLDPEQISKSSHMICFWKCNQGHTWKASINSRTSNRSGCPYCAGVKIQVGINDLKTLYPLIASEAHGWDPNLFGRGSKSKVAWKCSFGHFYTASISDRTGKDSGCPYCAGSLVLSGFNDLKTTHPILALQLNDYDPTKISSGSGKSVSWVCNLGHKWRATPQSRAVHGTGCPFCSGNRVLKGFNDLGTTHKDYSKQADGWDPSTVSFGSRKSRKWKCSLGHSYSSSPNQRTSGGVTEGCPYCHGSKILIGFNDLSTTFPDIAREADGWEPSKYTAGSVSKLWWKCTLGHRWRATPNSRTSNGVGCPSCAKSGFDPNLEGFLYFIENQNWQMLQIGITNTPDKRLAKHKKSGWELIEIRGPMDGHLTQQWETSILQMLKSKGADLSNKNVAGKFDGYSEAWSKDTCEVKSIKEMMRMTQDFEEET